MKRKLVAAPNHCKICKAMYPSVEHSFGWIVITTGGKRTYTGWEPMHFHKLCPSCASQGTL